MRAALDRAMQRNAHHLDRNGRAVISIALRGVQPYNSPHPEGTVFFLVPAATTPGMRVLLTPEQQRALSEGIRARDASAEEELVRLFSPRIGVMARTRMRDAEAARDVTQEVLVAVLHAVRHGQLRDVERLTAFVYGTARNLINNYFRTSTQRPAH